MFSREQIKIPIEKLTAVAETEFSNNEKFVFREFSPDVDPLKLWLTILMGEIKIPTFNSFHNLMAANAAALFLFLFFFFFFFWHVVNTAK